MAETRMENRRVLHIVDSLGLGGVQTILKTYMEARPGDLEVHLYALRTVEPQIHIAHPNVRVNASSSRFSMRPLGDLRRIIAENEIGVLHCHLFRAQVFGYLIKKLYAPRIGLVFHEHGRAVGREDESELEAFTFRMFLRLARKQVDRFICISDITRSRLLQVIPGAANRAIVVANPISLTPPADLPTDRASARATLGIAEDEFVVGFASRLIQRKGWDDFLSAVARLAPRLPIRFLLAGGGGDKARVVARIRELGLEQRGQVLGHIDWMPTFYAALDCFVMPSHWEPHGLAHLEAQSVGTPVVVSAVPGLGATVHANRDALTFPAGDVDALAACIERVATDRELRQSLSNAGRVNAERYSISSFSDSLREIHAAVGRQRAAAAP
jgi:glycosyltransferase involved in cell wall biosynthesis